MYDEKAFAKLFVDCLLGSHRKHPEQIVLDLDATDDPIHGYYQSYCYLPLYLFCGEQLLCAKLRTADRDAANGSLAPIQLKLSQSIGVLR